MNKYFFAILSIITITGCDDNNKETITVVQQETTITITSKDVSCQQGSIDYEYHNEKTVVNCPVNGQLTFNFKITEDKVSLHVVYVDGSDRTFDDIDVRVFKNNQEVHNTDIQTISNALNDITTQGDNNQYGIMAVISYPTRDFMYGLGYTIEECAPCITYDNGDIYRIGGFE